MHKDYKKGTCENMCPMREIKKRSIENLVHFYEKNGVFVKEFCRSAAGQSSQSTSDLRTEQALKDTISYLLTVIFHDTRRPYCFKYDFIFDRLRCIRQEIVIQNLSVQVTAKLLEPMIMFLAYSRYHLVDEPFKNFDPKICEQHLQECLKKVLVCYDEMQSKDIDYNIEYRCRIEAIYLVFNLGSTESLHRSTLLPKFIKMNSTVKMCVNMSVCYWQNNYFRVLKDVQNLPDIICAIASLKLNYIRRQLLLTFSVAYNSKQLCVPLDWLSNILLYNNTIDLINHLKYYNIETLLDNQSVKFEKLKFDIAKAQITASSERFVKRGINCDKFLAYFLLK